MISSRLLNSTTSCIKCLQLTSPNVFKPLSSCPKQQIISRSFGRRSGNKSFYRERTSPKRRREFNRKKRALKSEQEKHSRPGSKASARRQTLKDATNYHLSYQVDQQSLIDMHEYDAVDAMVDDLIGNTSHLTSARTPLPKSIASEYDFHVQALQSSVDPTDDLISRVVRAHRDGFINKKSNKTKRIRIGLHESLEHILQFVSIKDFGYKTYSSLMTTAKNGTEARRVMKLMLDHGYTPNEYCFSTLLDVYADHGDVDSCLKCIKEMKLEPFRIEKPSLPMYTSLLKACYKVVNNASLSPAVKARAGEIGWNAWQELRINGHSADVMAYGAIIRLCAARGQPERCINFIEEMNQFGIKPTTLIFTAALQAVSRSQRISLRFQGGKSKKHMRRNILCSWHGKMARDIVIMAENAEVEQDCGFVNALMLCAAAQGDSSTAKAIMVASEIRNMDHLRTIGSKAHINSLQPPRERENLFLSSGPHPLQQADAATISSTSTLDDFDQTSVIPTQNEKRRYLSALLHAYSSAIDQSGLGDLWCGDWNKGFLDEETLFRLKERQVPKYHDNTIPGVSGTDIGLSGMTYDVDGEEDEREKKAFKKKKFEGLKDVDGIGMTLDDLDEEEWEMFKSEDKAYQRKLQFLRAKALAIEQKLSSKQLTNQQSGLLNSSHALDAHSEDEKVDFNDEGEDNDGVSPTDIFKPFEPDKDFEEKMETETNNKEILIDDFILNHSNDEIHSSEELEEFEKVLAEIQEIGKDIDAVADESFYVRSEVVATETQTNHLEDQSMSANIDFREKSLPDIFDASLPVGLPPSRVRKIRQVFKSTLAEPSLVELVPLVRETLPEYSSMSWLKRKNVLDARIAIYNADEHELVDSHVLHSMLQVEARAGNIDKAIAFHDEQFALSNLVPSAASDRVIFQLLVGSKRISRALHFKEKIESEGRILDLPSYGSIIFHNAARSQLGSALMLIRECIQVHGEVPGEQSLKDVRQICRKLEISEEIGIDKLIGNDPQGWYKKGERVHKREKSRRGNKLINGVRNTLLRM